MIQSTPYVTIHARQRAQQRAGLSDRALIALWHQSSPACPSDFCDFDTYPRPDRIYRVGTVAGEAYMLVASADERLITLIPERINPDVTERR